MSNTLKISVLAVALTVNWALPVRADVVTDWHAVAVNCAQVTFPADPLPTDPYVGGTGPGEWRPTRPALLPGRFRFLTVTAPLVMNRVSQFRPQRHPPLTSVAYQRA